MSNRTISAASCAVTESSRTSARALERATDEELVGLVRSGSARAFEEIANRYQRRLRCYCAQFVGPAQAEDAVQQALLRAYVALQGESRRDIALRPWLYRIARNCAIDLLRSAPPDHEQLDLEYDGVPQPPRLVEQKEEMGRLVAALHELPEGQRRALTLRELEGRSYQEISQTLGQSGPGVRQMIFRARTTLRSGFGALLPAGSLRSRILGTHSVPEAHHVLAVTKISSCGGLEAVGVAAAAALTLMAGMPAAAPRGSVPQQPQARVDQVIASRQLPRTDPALSGGASARGGLLVLRLPGAARPSAADAASGQGALSFSVARSVGRPEPSATPARSGATADGPADSDASAVSAAGGPPERSAPVSGDAAAGGDPDPPGSSAGDGESTSPPDPAPDPDTSASTSQSSDTGAGCLLTCGGGLLP